MDKLGVKINMAIHHFGILDFFLKDHLNEKNKFKVGKVGTLFAKEEQIVHWVLNMQHIGLFVLCLNN